METNRAGASAVLAAEINVSACPDSLAIYLTERIQDERNRDRTKNMKVIMKKTEKYITSRAKFFINILNTD